jgi:hypothetical protein
MQVGIIWIERNTEYFRLSQAGCLMSAKRVDSIRNEGKGISLVAPSSSTIDGGRSSCLSTPDKDVLMQVLKEYHPL